MSGGINAPFGITPYQNLIGNGDVTKVQTFKIDRTSPSIYAGDPVTMAQWDETPLVGAPRLIGRPGTIIPLSALSPTAAAKTFIIGYLLSVEYTSVDNIYTTKFPFWSQGAAGAIPVNSPITAYVNVDPYVVLQVLVSTSTNDLNDAIFLNSFINLNGQLRVGGVPITANIPANLGIKQNPVAGNEQIGQSAYYLDGSTLRANAAKTNTELDDDSLTDNFKVMGIVEPQTIGNVGNTNAQQATILNARIPGVDMPFVTVYGVINNHMYKLGTPGVSIVGE